jgi:hypothetical protein
LNLGDDDLGCNRNHCRHYTASCADCAGRDIGQRGERSLGLVVVFLGLFGRGLIVMLVLLVLVVPFSL